MSTSTIATGSMRYARQAGLVVVAIVFLVYSQSIFFDFVGWDDALFITSNPRFNPPTWATVGFYWTHAGFNLYMPVTYSLWAAVAKFAALPTPDPAGNHLNPFVFHLVGLLCHLVATTAVYGILLIAVRSVAAAMMGAIVFGIHPISVESVAFIGTMNTPLAAALALTAVWLYLSRDPSRGRARLMLAAILYALFTAGQTHYRHDTTACVSSGHCSTWQITTPSDPSNSAVDCDDIAVPAVDTNDPVGRSC